MTLFTDEQYNQIVHTYFYWNMALVFAGMTYLGCRGVYTKYLSFVDSCNSFNQSVSSISTELYILNKTMSGVKNNLGELNDTGLRIEKTANSAVDYQLTRDIIHSVQYLYEKNNVLSSFARWFVPSISPRSIINLFCVKNTEKPKDESKLRQPQEVLKSLLERKSQTVKYDDEPVGVLAAGNPSIEEFTNRMVKLFAKHYETVDKLDKTPTPQRFAVPSDSRYSSPVSPVAESTPVVQSTPVGLESPTPIEQSSPVRKTSSSPADNIKPGFSLLAEMTNGNLPSIAISVETDDSSESLSA